MQNLKVPDNKKNGNSYHYNYNSFSNNTSRTLSSYDNLSSNKIENPYLQLQKQIGNQSMQKLLKSKRIQPKLKVSQPGDEFEQEADRVAEQILNMPAAAAPSITTTHVNNDINNDAKLNRKCKSCEEEEEHSKNLKISRQEKGNLTSKDDIPYSATIGIDNTLSQSGNPIDSSTREFMETRFGHDFGNVRIHTNDNAAKSAESINSRAFTLDNNIVFGTGQYNPYSNDGKKLLSHELTHFIQQNDNNFENRISESHNQQSKEKVIYREEKQNDKSQRVSNMTNEYKAAVQRKDWPEAAKILNGFNDFDIKSMLRKLSLDQLKSMLEGADVSMHGWSGRVTTPINEIIVSKKGTEVSRVGSLEAQFQAAIKRKDWPEAAKILNGFNDQDIQSMIKKLSIQDMRSLMQGSQESMPGWSQRVVDPIKEIITSKLGAEASRVDDLNAKYEAAVTRGDWENAVVFLNGFNDSDITLMLKSPKLDIDKLQSMKEKAPKWATRVTWKIDMTILAKIQDIELDKAGIPLSLNRTLSGNESNIVIEGEIQAIKKWLRDHPVSSKENIHLVETLNRLQTIVLGRLAFGMPSTRSESSAISSMSTIDKLIEALKRSEKHIAPEIWENVKELLSPASMAMMVSFTTIFIVAQANPGTWIADVALGLVIVSALLMVPELNHLLQEFTAYYRIAKDAKNDDELDKAGEHFAKAATKVFVDIIVAILLHKGTAKVKPKIEKIPSFFCRKGSYSRWSNNKSSNRRSTWKNSK